MGKVYVVGLGPGGGQFLTEEAKAALAAADVLCGYTVYVDLVAPLYPEKETYTTPMTRELERCRWALETAQGGRTVAMVCSGDAGVYGMAGLIYELSQGMELTIEVVPGVTAALSGGAGTAFDAAHADAAYARLDGGAADPGYFALGRGDVNCNGLLNLVDVQIAYDIANGGHAERRDLAWMRSRADVTGPAGAPDGAVDAQDAFAIQRAALLGWGA